MGDRKRGFVLAEVLVVAIIVAILAAVAVPTYTGYVKSQRQSVVTGLAQTAAVSGNVYWRRTGAVPDSAALKLFLPDPARFTVTIADPWIKIRDVSTSDFIEGSAKFH